MILLCAALLCMCFAGMAEDTVHDGSHHTEEWVHGQPYAVKTDSMETHVWVTVFDLYCVDCGRVIEENVRREETPQPHSWSVVTRQEPTCAEEGMEISVCTQCGAEKTEVLPKLSHQYADAALLAGRDTGIVAGTGEYAGSVVGMVITPSTCTDTGSGFLLCLRCQQAEKITVIPKQDHDWSEWEQQEIPEDRICVTDVTAVRHCLRCDAEETQTLSEAPGHQWVGVSFTEATCTEPGRAVRRCAVCGKEDVIETPAVGHCYMWVDVMLPNGQTESQYICTVCGDVAEKRDQSSEHMYYNDTITSFGPTVRELVGGGVWNRITPLDLTKEGMFTYPLIAGNLYTVGTATVINEDGTQTISYKLNSENINVHSETLVIYPSREALRTGRNAVTVDFDHPIKMKEYFGDDQHVLMAVTLKADFNSDDAGIQGFREDKALIDALSKLID